MTGLGAVCPKPQKAESWITSPISSNRSRSSKVPCPLEILSSTSNILVVPILQGVHLPQDSSLQKSMKYLAKSIIQVCSSITISPPEPIIVPSSCNDS